MQSTLTKNKISNIGSKNISEWQAALENKLGNKISWDVVTLQMYSTAACIYEVTPLAVVIPHNIDDIITTVNICSEYSIPLLPRGAGSSLSGNSVGEAVILDLTQHFKKIIDMDDNLAKVDVGVILNHLKDEEKKRGLKFAPDPSSGNVCVIGGMLGNNSGGPHTLKHGNMYKHVEEVNVVLSNGKIFNAKNISLNEIKNLDYFHKPYYIKVKELLEQYSEKIREERPYTSKNASGYQVWDILTDTHLNMASLMVGSEGTLGVFTDSVLKLIPLVSHRGIISLYFTDISKMGVAVKHLRNLNASAIEFVDQSFINLALTYRPELKKFLPDHVKYLLYVEYESEDENEITNFFRDAERIICKEENLAELGSYSTDEKEIDTIMRVRKAATVILNKIQGKDKPAPFVEDAAIHPEVFPHFLKDLSALLDNYTFNYVVFGHAGDGNLHLRPLISFKDDKLFAEADDLMTKFVDLVAKYKGSLSAEHGDGRLRTSFLPKTFPKLIPLFKEIKNLFDPYGIMNPEIMVQTKPQKWNENLRYNPNYGYADTGSRLDNENWQLEIEKCHGCGTCREYCPVFVATGEEEATARAKANLLRGIISGKISSDTFDTDHFYEIMNYCLNCGQCLTDCPTNVNIPGMAVLAKEKLHEKRPFKMNEILLQNGKLVSSLASKLPTVSNATLKFPVIRKVMEATVGIHNERKFPLFVNHKITMNNMRSDDSKTVMLWTGCAAQFNDPYGEIESSKQILEKLGYKIVLPEWKCCNVAKISYGNLDAALPDIEFNMKVLKPYVEKKIPIIFTSASCGYAFMHEYLNFFPDREDIKETAAVCIDIHDFLAQILSKPEWKNSFKKNPIKIAYHDPCHLKSQKNKYGPKDLLKLIPGLELLNIKDSCCGIAGTFGMKKENFDLSMQIGSKLFNEIKRVDADYAVSGCGTCQIQINQGTGLKVLHPMRLLNEALVPVEY
ncbi:MAG: anaerobic glycerol-3-phosphate dehydrogenase subunit C [Melioribacteraceae bacterium]|nr:anaerobic glycerol-3-phosphate dehydrogenase subunit C [Melioribacteraceae bacterium]